MHVVSFAIALILPIASATDAPQPASSSLTVVAVGDIMLSGTAGPELAHFGYDYPFGHVSDLVRNADVAFGNLEGPLTLRGKAQTKEHTFRSPPDKVAPALARAGFDVMSLANNHAMDFGIDGLLDTMQGLDRAGIRYAGAGANAAAARVPAVLEANGKRIALLAYSLTFPEESWATSTTPGTAFGHVDHVRADVANARTRADIVLVSFHWGQEGSGELRPYQRDLGHAAIDAGAAVVIGHHPHVLQGIERYRDGVILYSLGNFVFGSYSRIPALRSAIAVLTFDAGRVRELRLHPINVNNVEVLFQPHLLKGPTADEVIAMLNGLSTPLGTPLENRGGVAVLDLTQ